MCWKDVKFYQNETLKFDEHITRITSSKSLLFEFDLFFLQVFFLQPWHLFLHQVSCQFQGKGSSLGCLLCSLLEWMKISELLGMSKPVLITIDEWYLKGVEFLKADIAINIISYLDILKGSLSFTFIFRSILEHGFNLIGIITLIPLSFSLSVSLWNLGNFTWSCRSQVVKLKSRDIWKKIFICWLRRTKCHK